MKKILVYDRADFDQMNRAIDNVDWELLIENHNCEEFNSILTETIVEQTEICIPCKLITVRPNDKPWMSNNIKLKIRQRNRIHAKAKSSNSATDWANFRLIRNEVVDLLREAKKIYFIKLEESLQDKSIPANKWWKIAKSIMNSNNVSTSLPPLYVNDQYVHHPFDKAECLNNYFNSISTSSENLDPLPQPDSNFPFKLENIIISEQDIKDQLLLLNDRKPPGPDNMIPKIIKRLAPSLVRPLTLLCNKTFETGTIPTSWKTADVNAIYKGKGSENDVSNYRPISITSCFSKIIEKVVFEYMFNYLKDCNY